MNPTANILGAIRGEKKPVTVAFNFRTPKEPRILLVSDDGRFLDAQFRNQALREGLNNSNLMVISPYAGLCGRQFDIILISDGIATNERFDEWRRTTLQTRLAAGGVMWFV